jgi:hypothetical protein
MRASYTIAPPFQARKRERLQLEKKDAGETRKFSSIALTFIAGEAWTSRQLAKVADIPDEYLHGTVFVVVEVTKEGERHGKLCRRQVSHSQNSFIPLGLLRMVSAVSRLRTMYR